MNLVVPCFEIKRGISQIIAILQRKLLIKQPGFRCFRAFPRICKQSQIMNDFVAQSGICVYALLFAMKSLFLLPQGMMFDSEARSGSEWYRQQ